MKILLYEPNEKIGAPIYHALHREGYDVIWFQDFLKADSKIRDEKFDVSLIEIDEHEKGLMLIEAFVKRDPKPLCIAIFRDQDAGIGFRAHALGSQEIYEIEHGSISELDKILQSWKIMARRPQRYEHSTEEFNKAVSDLTNLVNHNKPVLITGEAGTGKSYLAEHVHCTKTNKEYSLEEISCDSLNVENGMELLLGVVRKFRPEITQNKKGLLEKANEKGLIFFKNIQDLPTELMDVLVGVIETGAFRKVGSDVEIPFTAQFIASCKDISEINNENFDRRLYELLSHNIVRIPPLRDCPADIIPNSIQMIEDYCVSKGIEDFPTLETCAVIKISSHSWPGNYRELKSCIENAVICCKDGVIRGCNLNITVPGTDDDVPEDDKGKLIYYLTKFKGKKVLVMEALGITAPTLNKRLKLYNIDYKLFKPKNKPKRNSKKKA